VFVTLETAIRGGVVAITDQSFPPPLSRGFGSANTYGVHERENEKQRTVEYSVNNPPFVKSLDGGVIRNMYSIVDYVLVQY